MSPRGETVRLLVVDDSAADVELVVRDLRRAGVRCDVERVDTRTGWDAALGSGPWDIVLLDYALPQLSTLQLLEELGERAPDTPAIVVSGTITEESAVATLRAGARDFVTKQKMVRLAPAVRREIAAAREIRDRRATEAALGESEARFARLVENAEDIVLRYRTAPHVAYEYVSPSVKRILGYEPEQYYADAAFAARTVHPDDREAAAAADPEQPLLIRVVAADGRPVWLDHRQVAIRDEQGRIVAVEAVARDVTEQVLADRQLRSAERKFRAIFAGALDALLLAGDDRVYLDANPAACKLLGVPLEQIVGRRLDDFVRPELRPAVEKGWGAFIADGHQEGTFELVRPDGEERVTEFSATANVEPGVHLSILRDTTARRHAEQSLRMADERFRTMIEELPLVVFSVPLEGTGGATYVSPQTEELLGLPAEAWSLRPELFWAALHPDDLARIQELQLMDRGAADFRLLAPGGRELSVHGQHRFLRAQDGTPTHYQGFLIDVTELTASKAALRESDDRLRQAQKMEAIGQLAGGVAHDFNNLLTIISGYGDIALGRCNGDDHLRESIVEIRRAADRAAELTQQLLAVSRRQMLKAEVFDLNDVVAEHASMLSRLLGEDIQLDVTLGAHDGYVEADPGQLAQVLLNLAVNARDAMPAGGTIGIRTGVATLAAGDPASALPAGPYVTLEVSDTGCGIDAGDRVHVFEPFFTTKDVGEGTGLGLSTVFGIVEQSRGSVAVESDVGRGTTFLIHLPQARAPVSLPQPRAAAVTAPPVEGETVLLVEDDEIVRTLVERILLGSGYTVLVASTPGEALALSEEARDEIRLLITDVVMPEMNGRLLAERLLEQRPGLRVLYMSGYPKGAMSDRGGLPSGTAFLQKPFTPATLVARAHEALQAPAAA